MCGGKPSEPESGEDRSEDLIPTEVRLRARWRDGGSRAGDLRAELKLLRYGMVVPVRATCERSWISFGTPITARRPQLPYNHLISTQSLDSARRKISAGRLIWTATARE